MSFRFAPPLACLGAAPNGALPARTFGAAATYNGADELALAAGRRDRWHCSPHAGALSTLLIARPRAGNVCFRAKGYISRLAMLGTLHRYGRNARFARFSSIARPRGGALLQQRQLLRTGITAY